jgi:HAD superfamily hydrolase (TIGR01549 family)
VDSREKNLAVTRTILKTITGKDPDVYPALRSLAAYSAAQARSQNWREFYKKEFGLSEELIDETGRAWSLLQLSDATPVNIFPGLHSVLHELRDLRHGIVSQNAKRAIERVLENNKLSGYFNAIIGYEEVDLRRQKPAPDGLLKCIDVMMPDAGGTVLYIGDHETDALCARNANEALRARQRHIRVLSAGATYGLHDSIARWGCQPDHEATTIQDIVALVKSPSPRRTSVVPPDLPLSPEVSP